MAWLYKFVRWIRLNSWIPTELRMSSSCSKVLDSSVLRRSKTPIPPTPKITLRGEHSLDVLQLDWTDLICVKSANNYVEVYYQRAGQLHKKLLRATSKSIQQDLPKLKRVHRSYLINPLHFVEWRSKKLIVLTHLEVPVSQSYQGQLRTLTQIHP